MSATVALHAAVHAHFLPTLCTGAGEGEGNIGEGEGNAGKGEVGEGKRICWLVLLGDGWVGGIVLAYFPGAWPGLCLKGVFCSGGWEGSALLERGGGESPPSARA